MFLFLVIFGIDIHLIVIVVDNIAKADLGKGRDQQRGTVLFITV